MLLCFSTSHIFYFVKENLKQETRLGTYLQTYLQLILEKLVDKIFRTVGSLIIRLPIIRTSLLMELFIWYGENS